MTIHTLQRERRDTIECINWQIVSSTSTKTTIRHVHDGYTLDKVTPFTVTRWHITFVVIVPNVTKDRPKHTNKNEDTNRPVVV